MLHVREVEVAIPAEDGSYGRAVGFIQDISDRVLAEKAIELIDSQGRIDLVLSDMIMPGALDGAETISIAQSKMRNVKVLLMSGFPSRVTDDPSVEKMQVPVLRKPFMKSDLARAVRGCLDSDPPRAG